MGRKRQFHANLTIHNHIWLKQQAKERELSMNDLVNEMLSALRKKSGTEVVQKPCVTGGVQ